MITLELNKQQLDVIWAALNEMPVKHALPVMQEIEKQIKKIENDRQTNSVVAEG